MTKKKAFLVTFSVTTRIVAVPDSDGDLDENDLDKARFNAIEAMRNDGIEDHLEDYEEDNECPYDADDEDNSDL